MNSAQQLWLEQVGSVLETLNQGVIINDEGKQIVFVNSKFLEMIKSVPESNVFNQFELSLSENQIPHFVGNVSS